MEEHGIDSGGGKVADVFTHSPIDSIAKTHEPTKFLGYETTEAEGGSSASSPRITCAKRWTRSATSSPVTVVLDQTPFYGESGGQVGDTGELVGDGFRFEVIDTQKEKGFTLAPRASQAKACSRSTPTSRRDVDAARRAGIRRAHSATHILHHALQKYLGSHAQQQGCKVDDDWLRFDFANPSAIDRETLEKIENEVNDLVTRGRSRRLGLHADRRRAQDRRDDAVWREVSGDRARGLDGRFQQGAVRRHAREQHRPGGAGANRRRGKRLGRHAARDRASPAARRFSACGKARRCWPKLRRQLRSRAGECAGARGGAGQGDSRPEKAARARKRRAA